LANTEILNFENVAGDAQVPPRTVREYFLILQDTLIGVMLEPYKKTKSRKAVSTAKFYFFDVGVCNFLSERANIKPKTELFGKVFEHFIFTELRAYLDYTKDLRPLKFWRSSMGAEVDFILGDDVAIEVKGSEAVSEKHLKGLKFLNEEVKFKRNIVVSLDAHPRRLAGVDILPVRDFLTKLWGGAFAK
jgi:predicted AAA+ superfamily ATPase